MLCSTFARSHFLSRVLVAVLVTAVVVLPVSSSFAGHRGFRSRSVGGISIDSFGVVGEVKVEDLSMLLKEVKADAKPSPAGLTRPTEMRMISLRGLQAAIEDAQKNRLGRIPDEARYLAGIQRIQYVFVYPEQNDIVLAGPGEGWRVDKNANVVGITTGRPVLLLDDLLVALRSVKAARDVGIFCSIDPTQEGRQNLQNFLKKQKRAPRGNGAAFKAAVEKAMGPQKITLSGVPADSHFARVLVGADYRMKRLAMNLDKAPVAQLPSFVTMLQQKRKKPRNMTPRWWLACNYESLSRSEDGMAWQLNGSGVKAMTEDDFIADDGAVKGAGRKDPTAQAWADQMTAKYDELSKKDIIFGELRNIMDMCVVAAVIEKEGLLEKAGCSVPLLTSNNSELKTDVWHAPKQVATQCSLLNTGRGVIVTASGGVEIESWQVASQSKIDGQINLLRDKAKAGASKQFWWN